MSDYEKSGLKTDLLSSSGFKKLDLVTKITSRFDKNGQKRIGSGKSIYYFGLMLFVVQFLAFSALFYAQFKFLTERVNQMESDLEKTLNDLVNYKLEGKYLDEAIYELFRSTKSDDEASVILNLTYPIRNDMLDPKVNEQKTRYKRHLIKSGRKPSRKLLSELNNSTSLFNSSESVPSHDQQSQLPKVQDILLIKKQENNSQFLPTPNDHFFIQAYSKISVKDFFSLFNSNFN